MSPNDWQIASKKYCDLLEEMAEELRRHTNEVPDNHATLLALETKNEDVRGAGSLFRERIKRVRALIPASGAR